jgi:D-glycero-D-manno-heptose 1,7-bisphosphate phosphatase
MFRAIFLDRDGVIIENRPEYVRSWSDVEILPGVPQALSGLREYKLVVVTNQSAVGRGLMTLGTAQAINNQLVEELRNQRGQIDAVYMCPHAPDARCSCRKPNPGLLLQAARELSLDLGQSWMIGDAWTDLLAGQAAGVRGVAFVRTGRGNEQLQQPRPETLDDYYIFNDLGGALSTIQKLDALPTALERSRQARR